MAGVEVLCEAERYGGKRVSSVVVPPSSLSPPHVLSHFLQDALGLPGRPLLALASLSGEPLSDQEVQTSVPSCALLLIDGSVAEFSIERKRSNVPVKGFLDDLATCQYTILLAMCELIDNSVQSTKGNSSSEGRTIDIDIDEIDSKTFTIFDNGMGFTLGDSADFATIGKKGRMNSAGEDVEPGTQKVTSYRSYFTSNISRSAFIDDRHELLASDVRQVRGRSEDGATLAGSQILLEVEAKGEQGCAQVQL